MTTRYEDAISVLGIENKDLVDNIEKKLQNKVEKSNLLELITKSVNEVDKAISNSVDELLTVLENMDKSDLVLLFRKMLDSGDITQDNLSKTINEMVNSMTDKSQKAKCKDNDVELENEEEKTKKSKKPEEKSEIVNSTVEKSVNVELGNKLDKIIELLTTKDTANNEVVNNEDQKSKEVPFWKTISVEFDKALEDIVLNKTGIERQVALQNLLNSIGEKFTQLINQLENNVENVNNETLKSMVNEQIREVVGGEIAAIKQSINDLANTLNQVLASQTRPVENPQTKLQQKSVPVSKGINTVPQIQKTQARKTGASIMDIVNKTVF